MPRALRARLAAKAFARTAAYDAAIAAWYAREVGDDLPDRLVVAGRLRERLRYGENPHQSAALYLTAETGPSIATARQVQGKELSYNNINDADAAFELVSDLDRGAPGGRHHQARQSLRRGARRRSRRAPTRRRSAAIPVSAYGGIVAVNRPLDRAAAEAITGIFTEVVVAPDADAAALDVFAKKANLRLLLTGGMADPAAKPLRVRSVAGGLLVQERDAGLVARADCRVVTKRAPSEREMDDLLFAFRVAKHVKSNAIVYAKDGATVGIGAGQMSRVDSARIAAIEGGRGRQGRRARRAADARVGRRLRRLLPLRRRAARRGRSRRDRGDPAGRLAPRRRGDRRRRRSGLAMVFTGMRHFRH